MKKSLLSAAMLAAISMLLISAAWAQVAITGRIQGMVTDPSGAAVPGAQLTVSGPALMTPRTTTTQSDGSYVFEQLPPGAYELSVAASGFSNLVQRGIVINPGFTATIRPQLKVGQVSQSVEVTGEGPVVDVKSNQNSTTFDNALLQNIPSGRDPWSTVEQAPGTTPDRFDVAGNQSFQQSTMEVHGSVPGEQVYSFNGLRMNWPGATGGYTSFYIDHDSLQQFQVVSDNAPAEVGVGGVYMNMVPKSGSNQLHGLAAIYYDSAGTSAGVSEPTFNGNKVDVGSPIIMTRDTTAQLGGPILKDRWWIFGSWRLYNIKESILSVRRQDGTPISDPNHQTNALIRSDFQLTKNNRLNFVWWFNEQNRFFRRDEGLAFVAEEAAWRQIEPAYILQGQWTSVVRNNLVVDTRFGYMHQLFPLGQQPGTTTFSRVDYVRQTVTGAPLFTFLNPAQVLSFASSASYYRGNLAGDHNFKFGIEASTNRNAYFYDANQGINAIYVDGVPSQVVAYNFPLRQHSTYHETAIYGQDAWTIGSRLTLNLGLRFQHFRTFNPAQTSPAAYFPVNFPDRSFPQSKDLANWNTFRPRIGVAYDLTGKGTSVLRASFTQFDVIEGTQLAENLNPNGFSYLTFPWNDVNGDGIPQTAEWLDPTQVQQSSGGAFARVDPKIRRPHSTQVNFGYEQQIVQNIRVGVNYYYRTTKDMLGMVNLANPTSAYTAITTRPDNGQAIVNPYTNQPMTLYNLDPALVGQSDNLFTNVPLLNNNAYHAVEFTGQKRMSDRWQLLAGFTVQRKKGQYPGGLGGIDFNNPNQLINTANSILDYDSPYVVKIDTTYVMPWNVSFSANFQHYTGYPLDAQSGAPPQALFDIQMNQGPVTVPIIRRGTIRLDPVNLLNLRFSRPTKVTERIQLEPIVDLFNVTNSNTVTQKVSFYGPDFLRPADENGNPGILQPFIARFGLRLTF